MLQLLGITETGVVGIVMVLVMVLVILWLGWCGWVSVAMQDSLQEIDIVAAAGCSLRPSAPCAALNSLDSNSTRRWVFIVVNVVLVVLLLVVVIVVEVIVVVVVVVVVIEQ